MSVHEIDTRDKRNASTHEAGHLTVACASGQRARAWVFKREGVADVREMKTWGGKCECVGSAVIAVAGIVAESMDEATEADEIVDWLEGGVVELSPTDAAMLGDAPFGPAVQEAFDLLKMHRAFFDWAAAELFKDEVITDGMAADAMRLSMNCQL